MLATYSNSVSQEDTIINNIRHLFLLDPTYHTRFEAIFLQAKWASWNPGKPTKQGKVWYSFWTWFLSSHSIFIKHNWSDYEGTWYSDYKSAASVERIEAFIKLGRPDPVAYADETGPVSWEVAKAHVEKVLSEHKITQVNE